MLIIDSREKAPVRAAIHRHICRGLHRIDSCKMMEVRALESGDFKLVDQCGHTLGVERKKGSDVLSAFADMMENGERRLYDQLRRMARDYSHRILLMEGLLKRDMDSGMAMYGDSTKVSQWRYAAIQMMLWGLQHGPEEVDVLYTANIVDTAEILRVLHQRAEKGCVLPTGAREDA